MYKEKTIRVFVKSIDKETENVKRFALAALDGNLLPKFSGGAHIAAYIETPNGLIVRHYSLTSGPDETQYYKIAVRLSEFSRGGSRYWHQHIKVGDELEISYPKNHFPLSFKARHHVFYAAGIGITPFLSMIEELQEKGSSFELHYASKSKDICAFYDFLKQHYRDQTQFYFSKDQQRMNTHILENHRMGTHVYFCGPDSFITEFTDAAIRMGYTKMNIHFERFTPPQPKNLKPFLVELKDGHLISVNKDQTLLNALHEHGVQVPYSCQVGRCGTCEVRVREGEIEHFDSFLNDEQQKSNAMILTCVSRAKSDKVVLEI
ncbi:PDR/VanB family oxidoreductase [Bacillus sp. NEB1478]|uniref:PDR/VanB family oxidoreductase n=1 Tax=Bacillus sp. NEB1478 TaxID=3073816 RepID=UPI0028732540|nr:PDR/VanB family oxidoreductase [Bacillus sp. NEB1478]WNB91713.1 PDR/VanB family oxidoreductase [Bacillus sp. NEB1478]